MRLPTTALQRWKAWMAVLAALLLLGCAAPQSDSRHAELPSWNDGASRQAIMAFVQAVTEPSSPDFVEPQDRIAVVDNDGTLWSEQPMYFQLAFALDRVKTMAVDNPGLARNQAFKAAISGDQAGLAKSGQAGLMKIVGVTHTNMSVADFSRSVTDWAATARHPRFNQRYIDMTYVPMRELLDYLRENQFKTYIVSGGEVEFMRAWAPASYGIPPEQIIGSTVVTTFDERALRPVLWRQGKVEFNDDGPGKPVAIQRHIGRRPILAFGNSDGDLQMLQWTMAGEGKRLAGLVHHTDAQREWAYDRASKVGRLDKALDVANQEGWVIVDMQTDWNRVYSFEQQQE